MPTHLTSVCQQHPGHTAPAKDPGHEDSHPNGSQQQQQQKQAQVPQPHERLHKHLFLCNLSAGPRCSHERTTALQTYPTFLCQPPHPLLKSFPVLFLRLLLSWAVAGKGVGMGRWCLPSEHNSQLSPPSRGSFCCCCSTRWHGSRGNTVRSKESDACHFVASLLENQGKQAW